MRRLYFLMRMDSSDRMGCKKLQRDFRITNPNTQSIGIANPDERHQPSVTLWLPIDKYR